MPFAVGVCCRIVRHLLVIRVLVDALLGAVARRQAQHGRGHRAPDGDQQREQQQKPDASGSHDFEVITRVCGFTVAATSSQHLLTMRHASRFVAILFALGLSELSHAELVPVKWDADGQFVREFSIAPGKFVEACEKLSKGTKVAWRFEAQSPLDFNVHYHEGKAVRFPARQDQVAASEGALDVKLEQDYCWMWTNKGAAATSLKVTLKRQ
jgi:hypothetical protein